MLSILSAHNYYQQAGGEDRCFVNESALLERHGHSLVHYCEHNQRIGSGYRVAVSTVWSTRAHRRLSEATRSRALDVAHFHNTFPLISPAAYYAARGAGLSVVQTLHNYRLLCPGGMLMRDGSVCEECLGPQSLLPAVLHGCYRQNRLASGVVAAMLLTHRTAGTWRRAVDAYIALSVFSRRKFIENGLPAEHVFVKPNFLLHDPGEGDGVGGFALYVGRLSEEKGIHTLAQAWHGLTDVPLVIAGEGPLREIPWTADVKLLGHQTSEQVLALMRHASVLIFPSICYECAPLVLVEAAACGLPVIASNLGSIPEFVLDHHNGLLFRPGDASDLATKVRWAFAHPEELAAMRVAARREFEEKYTADRNYKILMNIYELAIENSRRRQRAAS